VEERLLVDGWAYGAPARAARSALQAIVLFPLVRFLTPTAVRGGERIRGARGPFIVAANHVSHLDTPIVLKSLPRRLRRRLVVAAAKDYFYRGRLRGTLVSLSLATFPFDRGGGSRESLRQCRSLLERGWSLLIFPEGTRSSSGELGKVRRGAAVLASAADVPVLPVYVHGLADVMPKGTRAPLPGGVVVDIGDPIRPHSGEGVDALRDRVEASLRTLAEGRPDWGRGDGTAGDAEARGKIGEGY
jgi:1-acyl-sn-glycerol-3-phosphate acyltransferase